jgi:RND family efflux transporter MFP subunit
MAIVLGPNDIIEVKRDTIAATTPINGNLTPIEEIAVRARVEGDLTGVFAREGDRVQKGQLLASFENATQASDRASAEADRESANADVANAQWNAQQADELFKAGAIPEQDRRNAQQQLIASRARLAAAEARLKAATRNDEDTRVVAPTSGVVSERVAETGEHVSRGTTLFTVVRNDVLELEASVPSRLANTVAVGQPVEFVAAGRSLRGRVARVNPLIDPASRSITVYAQVPNANGSLKGNTFATGRIIGKAIPDAIVIPTAALRQSQQSNQRFVYRVVNDVIEHAPVSLGIVDDGMGVAEILDGLQEGNRIIVGNVGLIGAGMKVNIVSPERRQGQGRPAGPPGPR